jgi:hypothetical protein
LFFWKAFPCLSSKVITARHRMSIDRRRHVRVHVIWALAPVGERHARGEQVLGSLGLDYLSYYAALPGAAATLLLAGREKEADH